MKREPITLDVVPVESEVLKPAAFLRLVRENPSLIKSSKPVPPKPGERSFGKFLVTYTRPLYKHAG